MRHEEVKRRLLANPRIKEAYENPPLPLAVARAVVERRRELNMTQSELARTMETSQAQVWRIESGSFNPTSKTLSKLEAALGISFAALYRDTPPVPPTATREYLEQIHEWIEGGILSMSEEDIETALEMEEVNPGALSKLLRIIEDIELDKEESIKVTVRLVESEKEEDRAADSRSHRLELSAIF